MSVHVAVRPMWVGYSPSIDRKWLPESMKPDTWYQVWGYENGSLKLHEGGRGDATYIHFIGEGRKPCRLLQGNCVLALGNEPGVFPTHGQNTAAPSGNSGDGPGY